MRRHQLANGQKTAVVPESRRQHHNEYYCSKCYHTAASGAVVRYVTEFQGGIRLPIAIILYVVYGSERLRNISS